METMLNQKPNTTRTTNGYTRKRAYHVIPTHYDWQKRPCMGSAPLKIKQALLRDEVRDRLIEKALGLHVIVVPPGIGKSTAAALTSQFSVAWLAQRHEGSLSSTMPRAKWCLRLNSRTGGKRSRSVLLRGAHHVGVAGSAIPATGSRALTIGATRRRGGLLHLLRVGCATSSPG